MIMPYGKYAGFPIDKVFEFNPKYLKHLIKLKYFQIGFSDQYEYIKKLVEIDDAKKKRTTNDERKI